MQDKTCIAPNCVLWMLTDLCLLYPKSHHNGLMTDWDLSRQLEFEVETEVLNSGGEGGRGEERTIHLTFVVSRDGEETRHGIVGREGYLYSTVAAGGLRDCGENVALECALFAQGDV